MTSCEAHRSSAYHKDHEVAKNLGVDKSTVQRSLKIFHSTGNVSKRPYPKERCSRKLSLPVQLQILHLLIQKPTMYLNTLFLHVSIPTICNFLHRCGFSRQKVCRAALQRDALLRSTFAMEMTVFSEDMFVFVDE